MDNRADRILQGIELKVIKLDKLGREVQYKVLSCDVYAEGKLCRELGGQVYKTSFNLSDLESTDTLKAQVRKHFKKMLEQIILRDKPFTGMEFNALSD